jgi:cytochrome c5
MRRWLVILMLLVLPVQFTWAAAAPFCAHEAAGSASKHPGHHQHVHQGGSDASIAGDDGAGNGANHTDCASCHAGAATTLPLLAAELAIAPREVLREQPPSRYRSHTPSGPERPDIV